MARSAFSKQSTYYTTHPLPTPPPHVARVDIYQKFQLSFIASTGVCFAFSSTVRRGRRGRGWGSSTQLNMHKPRLFSCHPQPARVHTHTHTHSLSLIAWKFAQAATLPLPRLATWQFSLDAQVKIFDTPLQIFCTTTRDNCSVFPRNTSGKTREGFAISLFPTSPLPFPATCSTWWTFYRSQVRNLWFWKGWGRGAGR